MTTVRTCDRTKRRRRSAWGCRSRASGTSGGSKALRPSHRRALLGWCAGFGLGWLCGLRAPAPAGRCDPGPVGAVGCKHPVEARQVQPRRRDERGQPRDEIQRLEGHMCSAVGRWVWLARSARSALGETISASVNGLAEGRKKTLFFLPGDHALGGRGFSLGQQVLLLEEFVESTSDVLTHLAAVDLIRHRRSARSDRKLLAKPAPGVPAPQTSAHHFG